MACEAWTSTTTQVGSGEHTASACQINGVRSLYATIMRSLEVHHFQTEQDLELALTSGLVLPEQLVATDCSDCNKKLGYSGAGTFKPFVFVLDENDQDWIVCETCARPILDYVDAFFPPVVKSHFKLDEDEYDIF